MDWPFDQPPNCAVISVRSIVFEDAPILLVVHDAEDDGWQFLTNGPFRMEDAALVALEEIVRKDTTVVDIADLAPGWQATRQSVGSSWVRERP